jgi:hypothetical protein
LNFPTNAKLRGSIWDLVKVFFQIRTKLHSPKNDFASKVITQIGIVVPRWDQSRAAGAVGTGESCRAQVPLRALIWIRYSFFILSDTSFFTPSRISLWCVPFLFFGSFSTLRKFRRNCLYLFAAKFDSKILLLPLSSKL